jgi:leucyl-tRNA synthetase
MIEQYRHETIEPKWQKKWEQDSLYNAVIDLSKPKYYALTMLPYPSGDLHIGHWYAMTPSDARARYLRMNGYNVMFPIGFDSFGLPAENAAVKRSIHPKEWTYDNIKKMRSQLRSMGAMWDWRREAVSSDPKYYKWTQWFFIQVFKLGMAYRKMSPVDFCPNCNTTLAREQVWGDDRHCERCETPVIKKDLDQWFFTTTKYADELLDFSTIDWPDRVRLLQTNWIGRSDGASVVFNTELGDPIEVFTTRPDTLWGATFMVLAPEHPLVAKITTNEFKNAVEAYKSQAIRQTDIEREATDKEKSGVFTGGYAINPVNNERIPIWIADYVLMTYGTGAIMAVPAHDERDFEFALKFGLTILPVIERSDGLTKSFALKGTMKTGFASELDSNGIAYEEVEGSYCVSIPLGKIEDYIEIAKAHIKSDCWNEIVGTKWIFIFEDGVMEWDSMAADALILSRCKEIEPAAKDFKSVMELVHSVNFYQDVLFHHEYGNMINSSEFSNTAGDAAVQKVTEYLEINGFGKGAINYRLRDWLISRQRYWGAPIPLVYCEKCGWNPVPEEDLPVVLPDDVEWRPTGESPLKFHPSWSKTTCPVCDQQATRETDTMDTFMCSSWYHLRYLSPNYDQGMFDPAEYDYWMPVDTYTGGIEHATMHLIYTRFFHKAGRDMGIMEGHEPMKQLRNQGMVLGEDGEKMSKSRGNVVAPDELVTKYGADVVRAYLMFFSRWDLGGPWDSQGVGGPNRWLKRVWSMFTDTNKVGSVEKEIERELRRKVHQTLKKITHDFEKFEFNTIVSSLMQLLNCMYDAREKGVTQTSAWEEAVDIYLRMMAPVVPHIAEELWVEILERPYSIHNQPWPKVDESAIKEDEITLIVQVNGKLRDRIRVAADISEVEAKASALETEGAKRFMKGMEPRKIIYIPGRLVNIVI